MMELTSQKEMHLKQKMDYDGPGFQSKYLCEDMSLTSSFGAMPPVKENDSNHLVSKARQPSEKFSSIEDESWNPSPKRNINLAVPIMPSVEEHLISVSSTTSDQIIKITPCQKVLPFKSRMGNQEKESSGICLTSLENNDKIFTISEQQGEEESERKVQ
jgi:hypothetical protein